MRDTFNLYVIRVPNTADPATFRLLSIGSICHPYDCYQLLGYANMRLYFLMTIVLALL